MSLATAAEVFLQECLLQVLGGRISCLARQLQPSALVRPWTQRKKSQIHGFVLIAKPPSSKEAEPSLLPPVPKAAVLVTSGPSRGGGQGQHKTSSFIPSCFSIIT